MNILILSNTNDEYAKEDLYISNAFEQDGHNVEIHWVDYDSGLDSKFDIIIRRNSWVEIPEKISYYKIKNDALIKRLKSQNKITINLIEKDYYGKGYLLEYYQKGLPVIPTFNNVENALSNCTDYNQFILKDEQSFGSAFDIQTVNRENLKLQFKPNMLIQPKLNFKSEVQCYFVSNKLMYTFEFIPSKYPNYPKPIKINLNQDELKLVNQFVKESNIKVGFQRLDFLRLNNNNLIFLELVATAPFMDLFDLGEIERNNVINTYKQNIYDYLLAIF